MQKQSDLKLNRAKKLHLKPEITQKETLSLL